MTAFATAADLAVRLARTFTDEESAQADALLDDASEMIREHLGQQVTQVVDDEATIVGKTGPWLDLPERPVTEVTEISINGEVIGDYELIGERMP